MYFMFNLMVKMHTLILDYRNPFLQKQLKKLKWLKIIMVINQTSSFSTQKLPGKIGHCPIA